MSFSENELDETLQKEFKVVIISVFKEITKEIHSWIYSQKIKTEPNKKVSTDLDKNIEILGAKSKILEIKISTNQSFMESFTNRTEEISEFIGRVIGLDHSKNEKEKL